MRYFVVLQTVINNGTILFIKTKNTESVFDIFCFIMNKYYKKLFLLSVQDILLSFTRDCLTRSDK